WVCLCRKDPAIEMRLNFLGLAMRQGRGKVNGALDYWKTGRGWQPRGSYSVPRFERPACSTPSWEWV
ncbi:MAG: hypothetical protein ACRCWO_01605, partial [Bosea sp. (in: a-proteobacteria)]